MEKTERQVQFNELSRLVTASAAAQESQGLQHTTALLDISSNIARQMQQHLPGFQMHRHAVDSSITGLKTPVEDVAMRWHQSTDQVHILAWETLNNMCNEMAQQRVLIEEQRPLLLGLGGRKSSGYKLNTTTPSGFPSPVLSGVSDRGSASVGQPSWPYTENTESLVHARLNDLMRPREQAGALAGYIQPLIQGLQGAFKMAMDEISQGSSRWKNTEPFFNAIGAFATLLKN